MGNLSSIHFKPTKNKAQFEHNDRSRPPSYLLAPEFRLGIEVNRSAKVARDYQQRLISRCIERYMQHTGQKFQAKNYIWSAVVNLKPDSTMRDVIRLARHFKQKYGFQCVQIAIHRDEGFVQGDGQVRYNHHAHLEFVTLCKKTGRSLFRAELRTAKALSQMQKEVAEILGMQYGTPKSISHRKRIEPRAYGALMNKENAKRVQVEVDLILERLAHENTQFDHVERIEQIMQKAEQDVRKVRKEFEGYKSPAEVDQIMQDVRKSFIKIKEQIQNIRNKYSAYLSPDQVAQIKTATEQDVRNKYKDYLSPDDVKKRIEQERKKWIQEGDHTKEDYQKLSNLKKALTKRKTAPSELEKALDDLNAKVQSLKTEKDQQKAMFQSTITAKEGIITDQEAQIAKFKQDLEKQTQQHATMLKGKEQEIAQLKQTNADQQQEITALNASLEQNTQKLQEHQAVIEKTQCTQYITREQYNSLYDLMETIGAILQNVDQLKAICTELGSTNAQQDAFFKAVPLLGAKVLQSCQWLRQHADPSIINEPAVIAQDPNAVVAFKLRGGASKEVTMAQLAKIGLLNTARPSMFDRILAWLKDKMGLGDEFARLSEELAKARKENAELKLALNHFANTTSQSQSKSIKR
ncbi:coiled-coil domain-containing protein [Helicobacter bizzozeronii]|uniref:hypothetical protein n=1 Tax=Helicobacter bizzozeronii TaxID=56877 RepID=UPI0018F7F2F9|nr:hypothetical protein [Helicobacter bizzozeronii]